MKREGWNVYKVMVIDDEEIVRMGLRNLVNWEEEGYYICEEGKDGREGLAKILEYWPDLVLVDIKMPGLSGLDLIKAAREKNFQGHFVILTGFSEFEFAKIAISYGVREYLLKPIDEDELLGIMRSIRQELEQKEGEDAYHSNNENIAKEKIIRKILLKLESREQLEQQMKLYKMEYRHSLFCVAVITERDVIPGNENSVFLEKAQMLLGGG